MLAEIIGATRPLKHGVLWLWMPHKAVWVCTVGLCGNYNFWKIQ